MINIKVIHTNILNINLFYTKVADMRFKTPEVSRIGFQCLRASCDDTEEEQRERERKTLFINQIPTRPHSSQEADCPAFFPCSEKDLRAWH